MSLACRIVVAALLDKRPEGGTERGVQRFDVKHDVEVLRGAEVEPGIFHRERRSSAANQDVLVGIVSEVLAEQIEALHHGKVLRSSVERFLHPFIGLIAEAEHQ